MSDTAASTQPEQDGPHWTERPERGSVLAMRIMLWLSLALGRRLTRPVLWGITLYFFLSSPDVRLHSRSYLARVLPGPVRWWHVLRHFHWFSIVVHDRVFLLRNKHAMFDFHVEGNEVLHEFNDTRGGVMLFGAHVGSFEAIRAIARTTVRPVTIAMYAENARRVMSVMATLNPGATNEILPLGQLNSMLAIRDRIADGHVVGVLADRNFGTDTLLPVNVLGDKAWLPDGPFRLAAALQVPVFFMTGLFLGGRRYAVHIERIADFSDCPRAEREARMAEARQAFADCMSNYCRKAPYNWFNFYDFWNPPDAPPSTTPAPDTSR
ncbi:acyl-CoA synthetase [Viridibacterium curvum]|uniref:Acyltransferase n=1 Tax=Viridibacterium curvum TaxID=1101404 RepID=A0ABP9R070_9RHOO